MKAKNHCARAVYKELIHEVNDDYKVLLESGEHYLEYLTQLLTNRSYERAAWILRRICIITRKTNSQDLVQKSFSTN